MAVPCPRCGGDGLCTKCGGRGRHEDGMFAILTIGMGTFSTFPCAKCDESGKCDNCNGTGKIGAKK